MTRLHELASLIRSKNAGPFQLTIDIMFEDLPTYQRVRDSGRIDAALISSLYGISKDVIQVFNYDAGRAIKVTFPRPIISGSPGDPDVTGGQQYAPLVDVEI